MAAELSIPQQSQFDLLLKASPDPGRALQYLSSLKERHPEAYQRLTSVPARLHYLITVFSYSHFFPANPAESAMA